MYFKLSHFFCFCLILTFYACSKDTVTTVATTTNQSQSAENPTIKLTATMSGSGLLRHHLAPRVGETMITPIVYKMAIVNFWLIKEDNTEVNIINLDESNPTYTEDRPLVVDFSADGDSKELISLETLTPGTYTGWKIQMLYMEMKLPCSFHVPSDNWVTDNSDYASLLDTQTSKSFRLYFNAIDKYWKRDFAVELENDSGIWYWMRRSVNDSDNHRNFFIDVATNNHPPGGPGFESTIDLFADQEFWGDESDYSTSNSPIIVGTHSTAGGVNATMEESFTIPETLTDAFTNINLDINITGTMLFGESGTAPAGVTFTPNVLDLGPGYLVDIYGDQGLHPFIPRLTVTVASGNEDAFATATEGIQIPVECVTGEWKEPAICYENYCTVENATTDFCTRYEASQTH